MDPRGQFAANPDGGYCAPEFESCEVGGGGGWDFGWGWGEATDWGLDDSPASPSQHSDPPAPSCSITEFSRATPKQLGGPGQHTFLEISDPEAALTEVLESGPSQKPRFFNPRGDWGLMNAYNPEVDVNGVFIDPLIGRTSISSFNFVASYTGGQTVCNAIMTLVENFDNYKNGDRVPYKPIPGKGSGNYNSNSFTFTLLYDIGMVGNAVNPFPSPPGFGWTPGWGLLVTGLHP